MKYYYFLFGVIYIVITDFFNTFMMKTLDSKKLQDGLFVLLKSGIHCLFHVEQSVYPI